MLEIRDLKKSYRLGDGRLLPVVEVPEFDLEAEGEVALCGESGQGKTTFLHLIAGLVRPDAGHVRLDGRDMATLGESDRDRLRATTIGYIFQAFNLLPAFTCLENVLLGMRFGPGADRERAVHLLRRMRLGHRLDHFPAQLSTGQQQRLSVARALANHPRLVLADEPTGNLDETNAARAMDLIRATCHEEKAALLLVSHDRHVLGGFSRVVNLGDLNRVQPVAEEEEA